MKNGVKQEEKVAVVKVIFSDLDNIFIDQDTEVYVNKFTGEIKWQEDEYSDEEEIDEEEQEEELSLFHNKDYIRIESPTSRDCFRIRESFVENIVTDPRMIKELNWALDGKSPFRSFKEKLNFNKVLLKQWYEYEEKKQKDYIRDYFKDEEIEIEIV